jgi:hypothetical protein
LVDELWLKVYPLTLGSGTKLFTDGTIPTAFKVTESTISPKGIIVVNYARPAASPPEVIEGELIHLHLVEI